MKKKMIMYLLVIAMLFATACGATSTGDSTSTPAGAGDGISANADSDVFVIGTYLALTGNNSITGNDGKKSVDLGVEYINENGGMNGKQIVVEHFDTACSTEEAVKIVQKLIASEKYDAIIGSTNSNEMSATINYLNEAQIYSFGLGTSAAWMENAAEITWTYRASINNNRAAPMSAKMLKKLNYDNVAIISGTDDTGSTTADAFEIACAEEGITVLTRQQCDSDDTDFSGQIAQILATDPDVIYMSLFGATFGPFTKQLRNMGYKGMIACKESFSNDYQVVAGEENSNYIFYAFPYVPYVSIDDCDIPIMREYLERYQAAYNELPSTDSGYRGWDTLMVMWEASKIAGSNDKHALREATEEVKIDGLGGPIDYSNGDHEGYAVFNEFMLIGGKNYIFDDWLADGGYEEYLAATGRDR